ncbi:RNA polymerase II elongation factor ELL-like [Diadema antillarum]|uniref:RNA polymerase II elongation factor ELL-like n=1 Tax=Diadema antillarum TaxID=105358 RepID=UPI003A848109
MAADLVENFQYGLSSNGLSGADKTVLLLKLTDPSLKSIEQYQKLKYSTNKKPTIQFKGNSGVITFPSKEAKNGAREFKFTVQPLHAPPTSSFECIQHYRNIRGEDKLDSLGGIQTKVTVSGTDDVYQTTQQKMKLADQEMKKVSTKEVQQNQFKPGHRVKRKSISAHAKKIISSSTSSTNSPAVSSNSISYSSTSSSFNVSSVPATLMSSSSSSLMSTSLPSSSRNSHSASLATSKSAIMGNSSSRSSGPKPSGFSTKGSTGLSSSQKSAVHNRSYRDRIIHILALRPFKKPELLVKLQKDGIPTKEKNQLASILQQVAILAKDNSFVLNKNLYNEVTTDWPLYTEEDKQLLKRRKAELCVKDSPSPPSQRSPHHAPSNSSSSSSTSSSSTAIGTTGNPSTQSKSRTASPRKHPESGTRTNSSLSQKRPLLPDVKDYTTKKPRIAHNSIAAAKPSDQPQLSPSGGSGASSWASKKVPSPVGLFKKVPSPSSTTNAAPTNTTTVSSSPGSNAATASSHQSALSSPSVSTTRNSPDCCDSTGNGGSAAASTLPPAPIQASSGKSTGGGSNGSGKENVGSGRGEKHTKSSSSSSSRSKQEKRPVGKESPSGDVSSTSVVPDYVLKYTLITTMDQRHRYKEDFNNLYPEYSKLHKYIEDIQMRFKVMQDELKHTPQDSKEYGQLQDKVIEEYSKVTQDAGFRVKEQRFKDLHDLLDHIKKQIMMYDNDRLHMDT